MKTALLLAALCLACTPARVAAPRAPLVVAPVRPAPADPAPERARAARPRLAVLVVIDQFRADYLARTAASHAAIASGCNPAHTGIVGNFWYDREADRLVYSVEDPAAHTVGSVEDTSTAGLSLKWLERPTLGDAMQAEFGEPSIVLSFALKDRSALFLGGKRSDGSYWLDSRTGTWVTSSNVSGDGGRQVEALPDWVAALNEREPVLRYAGRHWQRLVDEDVTRKLAGPDDAPGEPFGRWPDRTFPHEIPSVEEVTTGLGADLVAATITRLVSVSPYGDRAVLDAAGAALTSMELGRDERPDLLALGFSALDYVGHGYGPDSQEVLEMVAALDRLLAELGARLPPALRDAQPRRRARLRHPAA